MTKIGHPARVPVNQPGEEDLPGCRSCIAAGSGKLIVQNAAIKAPLSLLLLAV